MLNVTSTDWPTGMNGSSHSPTKAVPSFRHPVVDTSFTSFSLFVQHTHRHHIPREHHSAAPSPREAQHSSHPQPRKEKSSMVASEEFCGPLLVTVNVYTTVSPSLHTITQNRRHTPQVSTARLLPSTPPQHAHDGSLVNHFGQTKVRRGRAHFHQHPIFVVGRVRVRLQQQKGTQKQVTYNLYA